MALRVLDEQSASALEGFCEMVVPGSSRVGPVVYIDATLSSMPAGDRAAALGAIDALAEAAGSPDAITQLPAFPMLRALAIEAFYSDFVDPDSPGPGAWSEIDFQPPRAFDLDRDWSYL